LTKALIFNSGLGKRMGDFTASNHKSMARLSSGETIFGRQLRLLASAGITDFVVTTGPFADQLHAETRAPHLAGLNFTFVENAVYDSTNYIYSLYLAKDHLDEDLVMLHGDLVFNERALRGILSDARPNLGMVNEELPQPEKDFKARVIDGEIREVSVSITDDNCFTFQPLYKLSREAVRIWLDRVSDFVDRGDTGVYAENALNEVSEAAGIQAYSYVGSSVNEVDTLDDLARVSAEIRLFDFAEQPIHAEAESFRRIPEILQSMQAKRPLLVSGQSFEASILKPFFEELGIEYVRFHDYSSNPKLEEVQAGLQSFREHECDAIISLGGGSALDVAKCIKLLAASGGSAEFPAFGDALDRWVPHITIPTTAGTGSESTHFAVVYIDGEKFSIAHDGSLPESVILEPRLLESVPEYHKKATVLDALSQCVESSWASSATEESRGYAFRGIELILDNLFAYFHKGGFDLEAARQIQLAANFGGKAINLTKTTAPHAMSYKMTSLFGIAHGHAVALCLAAVWRYFVKLADDGVPTGLSVAPALDSLVRVFDAEDRGAAVAKLEMILEFLQLSSPELETESQLDELVASVNTERLSNSPVPLDAAELRLIYEFVFEQRPLPYIDPEVTERKPYLLGDTAHELHENMRALHGYAMELLTSFDAFCTEHELQYYLSEGTILGAIRHGGLIPWDDDVDVMMPREDYRRFIELARNGAMGERYNLDSFETNPQHWVLGGKVQLTAQTEFNLPDIVDRAHYSGPYLDVFPVDPVDKTRGFKYWLMKFFLRGFRRMLFIATNHSIQIGLKPHVRLPMYLVTRVLPTPVLHKWIVWAQSKFNSKPDAPNWANLCTYYPIDREVFPKEWFGPGKRVDVEGVPLIVPSEAERMLQVIYGPNYMKIPNMEAKAARKHAYTVDRDLAQRLRIGNAQ